jgi:pyruvate-ferredoxin/flavodoxin oxidoreductase
MDYKSAEVKGAKYALQVAPDDCTGCGLCVEICPAESKTEKGKRAINMKDAMPLKPQERENFAFFLSLPDPDRTKVKLDVKGTQFLTPLFEFSGACTGCGETPYVKLLTQLYGDRALIANATGCSSIYGGNLPTSRTPWTPMAAARPGTTRSSRTTPSSAWACGSPSTSRTSRPRSWPGSWPAPSATSW